MHLTRRAARAAAMTLLAVLAMTACGADTDTPTDDADEPEEAPDGPIEAPIDTGPEKHRWRRPPPQ